MCFITYFKQTRTYCRRLNRYFHFVYVQRGRIKESYFALFFLFPLKVLRLKEAFQNLTSLLNRHFDRTLFLECVLRVEVRELNLSQTFDFDTSYVVGEIYKITFSILLFCKFCNGKNGRFHELFSFSTHGS